MKVFICEEGHITVLNDNQVLVAERCPKTWEENMDTCDMPGCLVLHTPIYQTFHCKKHVKEIALK